LSPESCANSDVPKSLLSHRQHRCHRRANIRINGRESCEGSASFVTVRKMRQQMQAQMVRAASSKHTEITRRNGSPGRTAKPGFDPQLFLKQRRRTAAFPRIGRTKSSFRRAISRTQCSIIKKGKSKSRWYPNRVRKPWSRCLVQMSSWERMFDRAAKAAGGGCYHERMHDHESWQE
jgi:hypothetical protein